MKEKNNFILWIRTQDEYTLARKLAKRLGMKVGYDEYFGNGICYIYDLEEKKLFTDTRPISISLKNYKFYNATEYFKKELKLINDTFCCKRFRQSLDEKEEIIFERKKFYIRHHTGVTGFCLRYCPFCGKLLTSN